MHEQRSCYRKNLHTAGRIEIDGREEGFISEDISVRGMRIHVQTDHLIPEETLTTVYLDDLKTIGQAIVVWVMPYIGGGSFIGLRFTHVEGIADNLPFLDSYPSTTGEACAYYYERVTVRK